MLPALETDHFRIRLGPLVGDLLTLSDFGIGQGKRAAVHLFGALVQGLPHELKKATVGIGLDLPRSICRAFASATPAAERETPTTPHLSAKARRLGQQRTAAVSEDDLQLTLESCTRQERLTILDIWAAHSLLIVQFVDDSFVFQSTLAGLRAANLALERFAAKWVHKFKGGKKRASVLAVGVMPPDQSALGRLQGDPIQLVSQLSVLGPAIDVNLSLQPHLDSTCARVLAMTSELGASLSSLGLGVPLQVAQFNSRVEPAVLHGAEILASCDLGFSIVASRLNASQYRAFKALVAVGNDLSLGDGGQARLFAELGVHVRLGARLALRVMAARARVLALPPGNTIEPAVLASARVTGATWLEHAASVMHDFGAEPISWFFAIERQLPDYT